MSGLQMKREQALKATATIPKGGDYVWDGKNEEDKPLTKAEMRSGMVNKGGRPKLDRPKIAVSIRYEQYILDHFKATGKGWQTKMNMALDEWIKEHH